MADRYTYDVPVGDKTVSLESDHELSPQDQQSEALQIMREHLATQTQASGWGAGLQRYTEGVAKQIEGAPNPMRVNINPTTPQGRAGMAASVAGMGATSLGGVMARPIVGALARILGVPAAEGIAGSMQEGGVNTDQLVRDTAMNAAPEIPALAQTGYRHIRPSAALQADDVARNVSAVNAGLEMPGYVTPGATPEESVANISRALTPEKGAAREAVYDRAKILQTNVIQQAGDPWVHVPSLPNVKNWAPNDPTWQPGDIRLSQAMEGYRDARLAVSQGAPTGGIQAGVGNKEAVVDAARVIDDINSSLHSRGHGAVADTLTGISAQERRGLGTQEIYTGMTKQGQQYTPLGNEGKDKLDLAQLQRSLRKAVNDGRFTADEADALFNSAIRRDAQNIDSYDTPGSLNMFPFIRLNPGGKMGMSVGEPQLKGILNMPRAIGSPQRLDALNVRGSGQYNPLSVLLGQILSR